jgi:hypothetical protein
MMETDREIAAEILRTLARLHDFGVQLAVKATSPMGNSP